MDGVAWQATVHRVAKSQIPLSNFTHLLIEVVSIYTLISSVCSSFFGHSPPQNVIKVFDLCKKKKKKRTVSIPLALNLTGKIKTITNQPVRSENC